NAGHYKQLFALLPGSGPADFVHFWSLNDGPGEQAQVALKPAFDSVFLLAQAAGEANTDERKNLWIVSNELAAVSQDDLPNPEKAILLGPCRTIPHEYPNLHCTLIDVGAPEPNTVSALLQCCSTLPQSSFVAYRMGRLWSQCVEPLPIPASDQDLRVRQDGVYFITGGLGGIGLTLALHLATKAK